MTNDDLLLLQTSVFTGITTDEIRDMLSCLSARETTFIKDEIIFPMGKPSQASALCWTEMYTL